MGFALTTIFVKVGEPDIVDIIPLVCTLGQLVNPTQQQEYSRHPTGRCLSHKLVMLNSNESMEATKKKKGFIMKCRVPSLWPSYIEQSRTTFAKAYGIKVRCYRELFGE